MLKNAKKDSVCFQGQKGLQLLEKSAYGTMESFLTRLMLISVVRQLWFMIIWV